MQAHAQLLDPANYESIESDLTWLGVAGLLDPPRPEVRGAIEDCVLAGIRVRTTSAADVIPSVQLLAVSRPVSISAAPFFRYSEQHEGSAVLSNSICVYSSVLPLF